jgi:hypothetical protein
MDALEEAQGALTTAALRERMAQRGVKEYMLAAAAGMHPSNLAAILHGRVPIGPVTRTEIENGIRRLGLDDAANAEPVPGFEPPTFTFRK